MPFYEQAIEAVEQMQAEKRREDTSLELLTCAKLCKALLDSGVRNITAEQALMLNEKLTAVIEKAEGR